MARKIKNLSVKTREYKDRDGNSKANWVNIGVIMENDQGKQFMLLDKWINFAGIPPQTSPSGTCVHLGTTALEAITAPDPIVHPG